MKDALTLHGIPLALTFSMDVLQTPGTPYRLSLACSVHPQDCLEVLGTPQEQPKDQKKQELED